MTPWTVAHQALSVGFSRQEYWSGLPCPPPGDLPDPGTEPASLGFPALQAVSLLSEPLVGEEMNVKGIRSSVSSRFLPALVILKLISKFPEVRDEVSLSFPTACYPLQCPGTQRVTGILKCLLWSPACEEGEPLGCCGNA